MWVNHEFETIFTSNDVMNIQYEIGKGFGCRERSYYMGLNASFCPIRKNIPHAPPNYGPERSKFEAYYYRQTGFSPEKVSHIRKKVERAGQ